MLESFLKNLLFIPRCFRKSSLLCMCAFYQPLNPPEKEFHKNGLRTDPATKYPSINHCEQSDEEDSNNKYYCKNKEVIRPKDLTKNTEASLYYIKLYKLNASYMYKWHD